MHPRWLCTLSLLVVLGLAACSPQDRERLQSGAETAAPTLAAMGTQLAGAVGTQQPTLEAAMQSAGTQMAGAIQTAGPTVQAAGTRAAGALATMGPTVEAAGDMARFAMAAGKAWRWQGTTSAAGGGQTPSDPASYTVEFGLDGSVSIKADCNSGSGTYTLSGTSLTITLGPMTLMACPEGSLGDTFAAQLGEVSAYEVQDDRLMLTTPGGTMSFQAP
jgi:heat shock protein HslJ